MLYSYAFVIGVTLAAPPAEGSQSSKPNSPVIVTRAEQEAVVKAARIQLAQAEIDAELAETRFKELQAQGTPEQVKKAAFETRYAESKRQDAKETLLVAEFKLNQLRREVAPPPRPVHR